MCFLDRYLYETGRKRYCLASVLRLKEIEPRYILPFSDSSLMELDEIEGEEDMEEEEEPQETDEFLGKEEEEEEEELEEEEMDEEVTSEESSASSPEWSETEAKESPEIAVVSDEEDEDGGSFEDIEFRSSSESEGTTSVLKVTK